MDTWETDFGPRDTTSCPNEQGMHDRLSDPVEEVRELVRKAKWHLPEPVRTSREVFFDIDNLWKIEIRSTCDQAVEFMGGVVLTINDGLNRAAAALSRSIHECCIRFHYLSHHEDELPDWFRWQWFSLLERVSILPHRRPIEAKSIRKLGWRVGLAVCGRRRGSSASLGVTHRSCIAQACPAPVVSDGVSGAMRGLVIAQALVPDTAHHQAGNIPYLLLQ